MKAFVTILFSLALVLSHLPSSAPFANQLCQSEVPCGCSDSACCVKLADSAPAPLAPAPMPDNVRTQLIAAFKEVAYFVFAESNSITSVHFPPAAPALVAVPLYVRNCSYLI